MKSKQATQLDMAIQEGVFQATVSKVFIWYDSTRFEKAGQHLLDIYYLLGNVLHSLTQRFEPSLYSCLTKIYKLIQHHNNLLKSLFKGKGGEDKRNFCFFA